jgi:hypothetical protein
MTGNISRRRIACESMVVGDEIKAIVLGLELQVLAHCTEKVTYMKSARWLYARKNPQIKLLTPKSEKLKTKNVRLFR